MQTIPGPARYIRREHVLREIETYITDFGKSVLLIGGKTALSIVEPMIHERLEVAAIEKKGSYWFGGDCTQQQIDRLVNIVNGQKPDVLLAVGGGKAMDTAKAVAFQVKLPLLAIPTIAATCAAATPLTILYDEEGTFIEISHRSKAPDVTLVDTSVILNAPHRFLSAGIGDTLAKWVESSASSQGAKPTALNRSAVKLAEVIYQLLLENGPTALASLKEGRMDQALGDVIDSIILLSGSVSGYGGDDCRTAAAHAIYSGLTIFPEVHETYHGEIVAFGILAQLVMEGKEEALIRDLIVFYKQVGLPSTLEEMGISSLSQEQWEQLGQVTVEIEDMRNMPFTVIPEMVIEAIQGADDLGKKYKNQ